MVNIILKGSGFYSNDSRNEDKKVEMAKRVAENYRKEECAGKRMDCMHDLTNGERQYLARKGIRGREFDNMSIRAQREWKQEMREGAYAKNDKRHGTTGAQFNY